jgi:hypothetical protein
VTYSRRSLYLCTIWLARLIAGEITCVWSVWFRVHYGGYKQRPADGRLALWRADHNLEVLALASEREALGEQVWHEGQNAFKLRAAPNLVFAGQPDLISRAPDQQPMILDRKTGRRRDSDRIQVLLYMLCAPAGLPQCRGTTPSGCVVYGDDREHITPDEITLEFRRTVRAFVDLLAAETPPRRTPTRRECRYCDISGADCDERIERSADEDEDLPLLPWQEDE